MAATRLKYFNPITALRSKLQAKKNLPLTGVGVTVADGMMADALADTCDWFWFDLEHNPQAPDKIRNHLFVAHGRGIPGIVRVAGPNCMPSNAYTNSDSIHAIWSANIKQAIDMGADGIVVPQIQTANDVLSVINDCKYPIRHDLHRYSSDSSNTSNINDDNNENESETERNMKDMYNRRGFGVTIGTNYGRSKVPDYVNQSNELLFKCVMIETNDAVNNIDQICKVNELDGVFIGSNDLSASLGVPYDVYCNITQDAIDTIITTAKKHDKYVLFSTSDMKLAAKVATRGVDMLHTGDDTASAVKWQEMQKSKLKSNMANYNAL